MFTRVEAYIDRLGDKMHKYVFVKFWKHLSFLITSLCLGLLMAIALPVGLILGSLFALILTFYVLMVLFVRGYRVAWETAKGSGLMLWVVFFLLPYEVVRGKEKLA
jgi:predicted permease